jgi:RNA polymerase sigma-70 factor (ECF subfamily)
MQTPADQALDELLVLRCQDGDASALDELVRRWQPRLWRHAWHLTRQTDAASDVTQESWIGIVRGIRLLEDPAMFRAWAYRIVTRRCADWANRRRGNAARSPVEVDDVPVAQLFTLESREEAQQLHKAIARLGSDQRAILSMRYWENMSTREIAAVLGVPDGTVKSRLSHARSELKQVLERTMIHDAVQ